MKVCQINSVSTSTKVLFVLSFAKSIVGCSAFQLRTVPTFVIVNTFYTSCKPWFAHARSGVDIDAINYATKYTTNIKAKFSFCNQINFYEPELKPGTPE